MPKVVKAAADMPVQIRVSASEMTYIESLSHQLSVDVNTKISHN